MRNFVQSTFSLSLANKSSNSTNIERNTTMKNIVKTILLLSLLLAFVGCGNTIPTPQEELETPAPQEELETQALSTAEMIIGASWDLDKYKTPYTTKFPPGKSFSDVVGVAIAKSNSHVYVWYKDRTASSGTSRDLDRYRKLYPYSLPPGRTPTDIRGMGIQSNDVVVAWYRDGTVSKGTSADLDRYRAPYAYSLPSGYHPNNIVGMAIASSTVITWFSNGKAIKGASWDLDKYKRPYKYSVISDPCNSTSVRGMGVSPKSRVYTLIKRTPSSC